MWQNGPRDQGLYYRNSGWDVSPSVAEELREVLQPLTSYSQSVPYLSSSVFSTKNGIIIPITESSAGLSI